MEAEALGGERDGAELAPANGFRHQPCRTIASDSSKSGPETPARNRASDILPSVYIISDDPAAMRPSAIAARNESRLGA